MSPAFVFKKKWALKVTELPCCCILPAIRKPLLKNDI
jgi:hypothetical protein